MGVMLDYISMEEITQADYLRFVEKHQKVTIEDVEVKLHKHWNITTFGPPKDYKLETTTVWSFPERGDWATHIGNYRGNWSPYIPRNLILKYSNPGDLVLDQMVGSGTTLVECKLLNRNGIGVDINLDAIMVTRDRLNFSMKSLYEDPPEPKIRTYVGDARNLDKISDESIDLVAFHPPYAGIISYTKKRVEGDLSAFKRIDQFLEEMKKVAKESYRVLKPNKYCALLIGDTRKHRHYVPIAFKILQGFLETGFVLKEDIIKLQWKMKSTREKWNGNKYDFYLIAHEHLFVFRKLAKGEKTAQYKNSSKLNV